MHGGARSRVCGSARSPERTAERPGAQAKHGRPGVAGRERAGARMMLGRAHCRPGTAASEHIAVRAWVAYASGWASIPIPVFELWLKTLAAQRFPGFHHDQIPPNIPTDQRHGTLPHWHGAGQAAAAPGGPCRNANSLILLDFVASRGCLGHLGHTPAPVSYTHLTLPTSDLV